MFGPLDFEIHNFKEQVNSMKNWCESFVAEYSDSANPDDIQMCKEATKKLEELTEIFNRYAGVPDINSKKTSAVVKENLSYLKEKISSLF